MADDTYEQDESGEGVRIKRGSWLQNCRYNELADGIVTWTMLDKPEIPERDGDLKVTLSDPGRPEQLAREFYGVPELWWVIAVANELRLPMIGFAPGVELRIPDPEWVRDQMQSEGGF